MTLKRWFFDLIPGDNEVCDVEVTEVRLTLHEPRFSGDAVLAYCTAVLDAAWVVHEIKVIQGDGGPFLSMPSRKVTDHCLRCGRKVPVDARYCNGCGAEADPERGRRTGKVFQDLIHPINAVARKVLEGAVLAAYREAVEVAKADSER